MSAQINQLVKSLLQKDSIDQCSVQELQQYAERHPYFGAAQLLLTKKLQAENAEQYSEQLQKTLLYFHNPLWVEQLLNGTGTATINSPEETTTDVLDVPHVVEAKKENEIVITEERPVQGIIKEETVAEIPAMNAGTTETPKKEEFLFEPFHTVDYFASQGIKFKEEEKPKDKFGLQLKSFTEWLRAMKKLPVTEIPAAADNRSAQKVDQLS
jgi:hypothetical protein